MASVCGPLGHAPEDAANFPTSESEADFPVAG